MPIVAERKEDGFKMVEPGTYMARCISMIEIGTVPVDYGKGVKPTHKVEVTWELPEEKAVFSPDKGEQPFVVSKKYTLSMHEKSILRKDLESWRGVPYTPEQAKKVDISKLIGQPCLLTIINEPGKKDPEKTYTKVASISKLMRGQVCPPQINPTKILAYDAFDWEIFDNLPDYLKDLIKTSEEYMAMQSPGQIKDGAASGGTSTEEPTEPPF